MCVCVCVCVNECLEIFLSVYIYTYMCVYFHLSLCTINVLFNFGWGLTTNSFPLFEVTYIRLSDLLALFQICLNYIGIDVSIHLYQCGRGKFKLEFSFSFSGYFTKVKELSLPIYLLIVGVKQIDSCLPCEQITRWNAKSLDQDLFVFNFIYPEAFTFSGISQLYNSVLWRCGWPSSKRRE